MRMQQSGAARCHAMRRELAGMAVRCRKQCVAMRAQAQQQELDLVDEYTGGWHQQQHLCWCQHTCHLMACTPRTTLSLPDAGLPIATASALNPEAG
jgi:hypothetical protein